MSMQIMPKSAPLNLYSEWVTDFDPEPAAAVMLERIQETLKDTIKDAIEPVVQAAITDIIKHMLEREGISVWPEADQDGNISLLLELPFGAEEGSDTDCTFSVPLNDDLLLSYGFATYPQERRTNIATTLRGLADRIEAARPEGE